MNKCASSKNCFIILDRMAVKTSLLLRGYRALQRRARSGCLYMAEHWCRNTYCKYILHSIEMILSSQQPSFLLRTSTCMEWPWTPHVGIMWTITVSSLTQSPWTWLFVVRVPIWPKLGMAPHSSTLAWKIPRTEEPGGLQSIRLQSQTRLSDNTRTTTTTEGSMCVRN